MDWRAIQWIGRIWKPVKMASKALLFNIYVDRLYASLRVENSNPPPLTPPTPVPSIHNLLDWRYRGYHGLRVRGHGSRRPQGLHSFKVIGTLECWSPFTVRLLVSTPHSRSLSTTCRRMRWRPLQLQQLAGIRSPLNSRGEERAIAFMLGRLCPCG